RKLRGLFQADERADGVAPFRGVFAGCGRSRFQTHIQRVGLADAFPGFSKPETEISFSNEAAAPGEELGVNYVSLLPYYPR
ncbi:MAG: hypothetical protein J6R18_05105, partial [Kiritimatiellae bacterium]|nr:hypothetical protein [Kiritimatiellia bacterium]